MAKNIAVLEGKKGPAVRVFNAIDICVEDNEKNFLTLEWVASPVNDMYADAALTCILQMDASNRGSKGENDIGPPGEISNPDISLEHFKECAIDTLQEMFGRESVPRVKTQQKVMEITVNGHKATLDFDNLQVKCETDEGLGQIITSVVTRLQKTLLPIVPQ